MRQVPKLILNIASDNDGAAIIDIDGQIGGASYDGEEYNFNTTPAVKEKLREISDINARRIIVNINSPGGIVNDGLAIHDALAQHPAEIITKVYGMTASAATIIAQAGDVRQMSQNALYLVHRAWGITIGNRHDMEEMIDTLEKIDERIAGIYARRSGKSDNYFINLMDENSGAGRFLDSNEAKDFGLVDREFEPMKAAASIDPKMLNAMGISIPADSPLNINKGDAWEREKRRKKLELL